MMEKSLNYEINTYFQNGKPSAVAPVMIEYRTNSGKGTINFDMVRFFPASVHDVKAVIDILWMAPDTYEKAEIIAEYLRNVIADLQIIRGDHENYNNQDCADASKVNGFIKRYKSNLDKIADTFGLETVADDRATVKMSKCEVIMAESMNGKLYAKAYAGKSFEKSGLAWAVFKFAKGVYRIAMPGTGYYIEEYSGKEKDAPEHITAHLVDRVNALKSKNPGIFEELHKKLCALCEVAEIPAPVLPDCMKENTPAPALDAETSEARPAADQEPQTAEKPATASEPIQETETSEEIKVVLSAYENKYNEFYEVQPAGALYGALVHFGIKYVSCELNIPGKTINETRRFIKGLLKARNDYFSSDRELAALASVINDLYKENTPETCKPSAPADRQQKQETGNRPQVAERIAAKETRTRAPYYIITRAERPQVWKPCIMSPLRKYGIIYRDIMGATDRQEPASADRLKAVLRLSKMQGCINIGWTAEKPITGEIQAHKGKPAPGGYPPNKDGRKGGNRHEAPQARKMPQVTVRGSPKNQGEKIIENVFFQTENFSKIV